APVRKIRQTLAETRLFRDLTVGRDGRNRALLSPFGTSTGRNAPGNGRFIFGPSAWVRGLIQPRPGWALSYCDFTSQEFAIADYWRWSDGAIRLAMATGHLHTCLGWATIVHPQTKPTSLLNWPIQSHAAEMLRLACCLLTERGIRVCAPVHDAVLVEAPADEI